VVQVLEDLEIPEGELAFTTSRSSGPGGQNVNKVSTRVTLLFDVEGSARLAPQQRELANRVAAVARFADLLREALTEAPERVPVDIPVRVNEKRLDEKRRRGRLKRQRAVDLTGEE
jgi:ribosome-associated protein